MVDMKWQSNTHFSSMAHLFQWSLETKKWLTSWSRYLTAQPLSWSSDAHLTRRLRWSSLFRSIIPKPSVVPLETEPTISIWFKCLKSELVSRVTKETKQLSSQTTPSLSSKASDVSFFGMAVPLDLKRSQCSCPRQSSRATSSCRQCSGVTGWTGSQEWTFSLISTSPCTTSLTPTWTPSSTHSWVTIASAIHNLRTNL